MIALAVATFSLAGALCGVADLFRTVEVTGVVLRRRTRGRTSPRAPRFVRWLADRDAPDDPPKVRWYLGVDTGEAPTVAAWSVPIGTFDRVGQGARVHASVTPLLGYVRSIETAVVEHRGTAAAPRRDGGRQRRRPGARRRRRPAGASGASARGELGAAPDAASIRSRSFARSSAPVVGASSRPTPTPSRNMKNRL